MQKSADVGIIGAGAAGLWLAYELIQHGITCILFDEKPLARYSSTRNQGWLQSGALYAALNQNEVAYDCRLGFEMIRHFASQKAPTCIKDGFDCFMLFTDAEHFNETLKRCNTLKIKTEHVTVTDVFDREPVLKGSEFSLAMKTSDKSFDTSFLLTTLFREVLGKGGGFVTVSSSVKELTFEKDDESWIINHEEEATKTKIIVVAAGAAIPSVLKKIDKKIPTDKFQLWKIPVIVLHQQITNSLIVTPFKEDLVESSPNIVPFVTLNGSGVTICLSKADREITNNDPNDFALEEELLEDHEEELKRWLPEMTQIYTSKETKSGVYICQKLEFASDESGDSRRYIILDHAEPELGSVKNVITFYPGKFTVAPVAAKICSKKICELLGRPMVANQKYFDEPEYHLDSEDGNLKFKK